MRGKAVALASLAACAGCGSTTAGHPPGRTHAAATVTARKPSPPPGHYGERVGTCNAGPGIRPCLILLAVDRRGRAAGRALIADMVKNGDTYLGAFGSPVVIRPGTCARPGLGRSVNADDGEMSWSYGALGGATFSVESVGADGLPVWCAQHHGLGDLQTDAAGYPPDAVAKRGARRLVARDGPTRVIATPTGRRTVVRVVTPPEGSQDEPVQLRRGTCRHVVRGRDLPLPSLPGDNEADTVQTSATIRVPFARFRATSWALELYSPGPAPEVQACFDL